MALNDQAAAELAVLAGLVLAQNDLRDTLNEIARTAVRAIPNAEGASLTTFTDGQPATPAASDDWAKSLDEMQYAEHEGPCLDCARTGNVLRIRNMEEERRWPFYAPRAVASGALSSVSLPMASEGKVIGALNLYARQPDAFSSDAVSVGEILAAHAGLAVLVATAFFGHRDLAEQTREAMRSRATIEQAKGILMGGRRCGPEEAFDILVDLSQRSNRKLRDVAAALVADAAAPNGSPAG